MAQLVPTRAFLKLIPDMAVLFARFGCTLPPPPLHPFCSHGTYPTRTLPEVMSQTEILMTGFPVISG